jgi:hypothetical protein
MQRKMLDKAVPVPYPAHEYTYWDRVALLPRYKAGEIHPNAISTHPVTQLQATSSFRDNTAEYIERYSKPDLQTYRTQFYFLAKLAHLCQKERIELVIVNMPITKQNIAILKPEKYLDYIVALRNFAQMWGMRACWDLNDFTVYNQGDYHDFVHLNAFGGAKFFDYLTERLSAETETRNAFTLSGMVLHQKQGFAERPAIDPDKVERDLQNILGPITGKGKSALDLRRPGATPGPMM